MKTFNMTKISVILPIYNVEKYLEDCLNSIINQTLNDIEIICIDDGSTDNSLAILNEYAKKDSRITILTQKNQGAAVARNKGLDIAKGEYLSILDSDDFFELNMLEQMYNKAINTDVDIVICKSRSYDDKTKVFGAMNWALREYLLPEKDIFNYCDVSKYLFQFTVPWVWNRLIKKNFVEKNNLRFQNLKNTNDFYFGSMSLVLAEKITILPEVLVNYRINNNNRTTECVEQGMFCFAKSSRKFRYECIKRNIFSSIEQSFVSWCLEKAFVILLSIKNKKNRHKFKKYLKKYYFKILDVKNKPKEYFYSNLYDRIQEIYHPMYKIKKNIQRFIIAIKIQYK